VNAVGNWGKVLGGAALATVGGLAAGTIYYANSPKQELDTAMKLKLAFVVGAIGLGGGLVLRRAYPNLSKGLIYGGIGAAVVAPSAASQGVFYFTALEVLSLLNVPVRPNLAQPSSPATSNAKTS